jgi:beta-mannosidase
MTAGPWKPVLLHAYEHRIEDLDIRTSFDGDHIELTADLIVSPATSGEASFTLSDLDKTFKADVDEHGRAKGSLRLSVKDVEPWYPVGYGGQMMYELVAAVHSKVRLSLTKLWAALTFATIQTGTALDKKVQKIGFRDVKVVEDKLIDQEGRTFLFEVNDIRIFCGGRSTSCSVPGSYVLTPLRIKLDPG